MKHIILRDWLSKLHKNPAYFILLYALVLVLTFHRAVLLNMDFNPGKWVTFAIPAALSKTVFNQDKKYTSNEVVYSTFFQELNLKLEHKERVNYAINKVLKLNKSNIGSGYALVGNDDKGIVDFTEIAFRVFGFKVQSLLYLYFTVLSISCLVFYIGFSRFRFRLMLPLMYLVMLYLVMPMVAYNDWLMSVVALRVFPMLSMVSALHCILFVLAPKYGKKDLILVAIQVAIIFFVLHMRTTTQWQLIIIGSASIFVTLTRAYKSIVISRTSISFRRLITLFPLFLIIVGLLFLNIYRVFAFDAYRNTNLPTTRVFWHNIFSGLAFDPELASRYNLIINDSSIVTAAGKYLKENGRDEEWNNITGFDLSSCSTMNWDKYDRVVREMFFTRCNSFPLNCFKAFTYYKVISNVQNISWLYGLKKLPPDLEMFVTPDVIEGDIIKFHVGKATTEMDKMNQRANLWSPIAAIIIIPFTILFFIYKFELLVLYSALILAIGSFIPTIIGYPAPHTILENAVAVGMLTYLIFSLIFLMCCKYLMKGLRAITKIYILNSI